MPGIWKKKKKDSMCDLFEIWMASPPLQKIQKSKTTTTFWYINVRLDLKKKSKYRFLHDFIFSSTISSPAHPDPHTVCALYGSCVMSWILLIFAMALCISNLVAPPGVKICHSYFSSQGVLGFDPSKQSVFVELH